MGIPSLMGADRRRWRWEACSQAEWEEPSQKEKSEMQEGESRGSGGTQAKSSEAETGEL